MNRIIIYITLLAIFLDPVFTQCNYDYGDANHDGFIDIIDIVLIVDIIFEIELIEDIDYVDVNQDDILNIIDLVILMNRILDEYPQEINISNIDYDFQSININWEESNDYGFVVYNVYYSNFFNNVEVLVYSSNEVEETNVNISDISLLEQNFFWIGVEDFLGCELIGQQYLYELPSREYILDDDGFIESTDFQVSHFNSAQECIDCHFEHYEEWSSSMHSHTMQSPLFFGYKNDSNSNHPVTGERFCMQCHNPVSYLTGTDLSMFSSPDELQSSPIEQVLKEGISCDVCHTITGLSQTVHANDSYSANAIYKMFPTGNMKFGPIQNPQENDFHESYYLPTYESSQNCLPCHDLVVNDVEAEITFTEWNRIPGFSMFGGVSCQECHMPLKDNGYHDHKFIGVDLDLTIPLDQNPLYEDVNSLLSTSAEIIYSIQTDTLVDNILSGEILSIPITVSSLTAHNIPSGTSFNREMWIQTEISFEDEVIFSSGKVDNGESLNLDDSQLLLFTSYLLDENGNETNSITNFETMENYTLSPYQDRYHYYNYELPLHVLGEITVTSKLLFRPFKPHFILEHHPEFIYNLPIFEISSISKNISVQ